MLLKFYWDNLVWNWFFSPKSAISEWMDNRFGNSVFVRSRVFPFTSQIRLTIDTKMTIFTGWKQSKCYKINVWKSCRERVVELKELRMAITVHISEAYNRVVCFNDTVIKNNFLCLESTLPLHMTGLSIPIILLLPVK